jgi:hypothetical protein
MKSYIKKEISEITGLAPRLVQFYTDEGLITPEVDKGAGRGKVRRYSIKNLFEFALIKELKDYGINIATLKSILGFIRKYLTAVRFELMIEYPKLTLIILKDKDNKIAVNFGVNYDDSQDLAFKIPNEVLEISDGEVIGKSPFKLIMRDYISFICVDILTLYERIKCK